ncbi:response regulator [Leptolyngbya sp. DQ-M1]|uniref:response regulator n=1 Tax=Leptolyngbya sp. DQ-M1 TaxID=2933920 RepID=UPI003297EF5F
MNSKMTEQGTILVVDDTPTNLEVLFDLLGDSGFRVLVAENGESALDKANYAHPDLILLDILMPGMDGFETCRRLKANADTSTIPIIFLTALTDSVDKVRGFDLGAVDFITKPLQCEEVLARVKTQLRLQNLTNQLQHQIAQERLIGEIAQGIRRSLKLDEVLQTTVDQVRQFLHSDRVVILRFESDWGGRIVTESVDPAWKSILLTDFRDSCFSEHYVAYYQHGQTSAKPDIYQAGLSACHIELLEQAQVRANLIVPILQNNYLWGLLIAHHCSSPREWQAIETTLLQQLATQLGIAIQQSELYERTQNELIERRRAEQIIREQVALLNVASDAIYARDLQNHILFWNQSAEQLYGWSQAELQTASELLSNLQPQEVETVLKTVFEQGSWQGEVQKATKSGKAIMVLSRMTLVRDESGTPKSILTVDTDITEKKLLEAQFLRAQRLESIGTLASGVAHDLNNILTPILASAQLLPLKFPNLDDRTRKLLTTVEANAKRGADLVKQVLSFARGTEGRRTPVQVAHLLGEIEQIANRTFPKSITVQVDLPPSMLNLVYADATQLHQVLMNLCINARDAMPDGGVLTIAASNVFIDESHARTQLDAKVGNYVMTAVSDTGTGIPPEVIDRIFDPFFTTKEVGKGTGLGLSTVLGIIKSHAGFIEIDSQMGQGTCFRVYLPTTGDKAISSMASLDLLPGSGEVILVVDDESSIQDVTKAILEEQNYRVLTASNGFEAISLYAKHKQEIAVILMDLMMPAMDGATAIRTLRKMNPDVRVIATSGLMLSNTIADVASVGVDSFLSKPYTAEELLKVLHKMLDKASQR